ncbi:MAG: hypothetical protein HWE13_01605 [Gammaproteobacteria bacterium]|nr:hypothetical protein [Gammaproteobacteria bacterium]NVK86786.1 hypothetical protein [Gammaproteobacteria bacterium]
MQYVFSIILAVAAAVAGYFYGLQQGQTKAAIQSQSLLNSHRVQVLGENIQYLTLLQQQKSPELEQLLKARLVAQKVQLESDSQALHDAVVKRSVDTVNELLKQAQ